MAMKSKTCENKFITKKQVMYISAIFSPKYYFLDVIREPELKLRKTEICVSFVICTIGKN